MMYLPALTLLLRPSSPPDTCLRSLPARTPEQPSEDVWQVLPSTAPLVPADMKEVFSAELACSVQDFYRRFVAGSSDFSRRLHIQVWVRGCGWWEPWGVDAWETNARACKTLHAQG